MHFPNSRRKLPQLSPCQLSRLGLSKQNSGFAIELQFVSETRFRSASLESRKQNCLDQKSLIRHQTVRARPLSRSCLLAYSRIFRKQKKTRDRIENALKKGIRITVPPRLHARFGNNAGVQLGERADSSNRGESPYICAPCSCS